jgi:hypothetical protein
MMNQPFKPRGEALKLSEGDRWKVASADVIAAAQNAPARLKRFIQASAVPALNSIDRSAV